jgi:acetyl-CoA carboxylase biotin carboxylase subunit
VCLGERECSIQRKNQKLLEESPSMAIKNETRLALMKLCVNTAKKIGYTGLGTMEFLADADGHCYFMEMNTRLQVEHPVTEMMTGIDLVKWQLRAAAGQPLNFAQKDIKPKGCAMECRINAENPAQGFRPASGRITLLHIPGGPHVRFDTAVYQDYDVPPYYDSLLGKLIVHAGTREEAIRKMKAALCELVIEGVQHNADMHLDILSDDLFVTGGYHTDYMEQRGY